MLIKLGAEVAKDEKKVFAACLLLALGLFTFERFVADAVLFYRDDVITAFEERYSCRVTVGDIDYTFWEGLTITDVVVFSSHDGAAPEVAQFGRIRIQPAWYESIKHRSFYVSRIDCDETLLTFGEEAWLLLRRLRDQNQSEKTIFSQNGVVSINDAVAKINTGVFYRQCAM